MYLEISSFLAQRGAHPGPGAPSRDVVAEKALEEKIGRDDKQAEHFELRNALSQPKVQHDLGRHGCVRAQVLGLDLGVRNHLADVADAQIGLTPGGASGLRESKKRRLG